MHASLIFLGSTQRYIVVCWKKKGVNVKVYAVDVAELDSLSLAFSQIEENQAPLAGVFHCAMVLDDGFLLDMNEDRFRNVLRPKNCGKTKKGGRGW